MQRSVFISNAIFVLAFISFAAQFFIDFSALNISAACIVLTSSLITLGYFRWTNAFVHYPLSSFAIFGLLVTTQFGALVSQFLLGDSLTKDLRVPVETFSYLFMFQMTALLAHAFYRMLNKTKKTQPSFLRYSLEKLGIYQTPSILVVWLIGGIGLAAAILAKGDAGSKVAQGLSFLMWLPFIIPIYRARFGKAYCDAKLNYILLGLYSLLVVVIGIVFNARGFMLNGMVTIGAVILLETMRSNSKFTGSQLIKVFFLLIIGIAVSFPLSDLSTAMVVTRGDRGRVSNIKLAQNTLEVLTAKRELIQQYRENSVLGAGKGKYDETYIKNPLLARFAMTKFSDNMFYFGAQLNEEQVADLSNYSFNKISSILPDPLLHIKWLGVNVDKNQYGYSTGDQMVFLATGIPPGGLKTGSAFAQGFTIFGYFYTVVYFSICIILFYLKDVLSYKNATGAVVIAPIGLFGLYGIFLTGINTESLHLYVLEVIRGFPQNIILYVAVFQFARLIEWMWKSLGITATKKSAVTFKLKPNQVKTKLN